MEKHVDVNHAAYIADITELIKHDILSECYISNYVTDVENEEATYSEGLKVMSIQCDVLNSLKQNQMIIRMPMFVGRYSTSKLRTAQMRREIR